MYSTKVCSLGLGSRLLRLSDLRARGSAAESVSCSAKFGNGLPPSGFRAVVGIPGAPKRSGSKVVKAPGVGSGASGSQFTSGAGGGGGVPPVSGSGSGGGGKSSAGPGGLWSFYLKALESNPILTKAITASVLNAIGDLACQILVEKNEKINLRRFAIFATMGLVMIGPVLHYWYGFNQALISAPGLKGGLMRMAIDQVFFAPVFVAACFSTLFLLEGKPKEIPDKLKSDLKPAVFANWKLWVPAQFINFVYVPPPLRVAFSSCVSLLWNVYLSFASNNKLAKPVV